MRELYRALVETRALGERLPRTGQVPRGLEACWAATALDLHEGDLTSDRAAGSLPGYLRAIVARKASGLPGRMAVQALLSAPGESFAGTAVDRLLCATGAAMALKAEGERSVSLAYVRPGELSAADWKRVLRVAAVGELPLVIVAAGCGDLPPSTSKVPVIPVDAADAVAIYRVAQESLLRARAEGGVVVIECVRTRLDPVVVLGGQLSAKGIATTAWMAGAESRMRTLLASAGAVH